MVKGGGTRGSGRERDEEGGRGRWKMEVERMQASKKEGCRVDEKWRWTEKKRREK